MDYMRINAAQCGATLGKYILVVERNPVDTNYSEDKKNDFKSAYLFVFNSTDRGNFSRVSRVNE